MVIRKTQDIHHFQPLLPSNPAVLEVSSSSKYSGLDTGLMIE